MPIARFPKEYLEKQDNAFLVDLIDAICNAYDEIDRDLTNAIREILTLKYPESTEQEETE